MPFTVALLCVALGAGAFPSDQVRKPCTNAEVKQADEEFESWTDWDRIYRAYKRFSHCDDGIITEEYDYAIGNQLAYHWKRLGRLMELTKRDSEFRKFVLRHINAVLDDTELQKISSNARTACPAGAWQLCREIAQAAEAK